MQVSHTIPDHQVSYPHVECRVKTSLVCLGEMVELFLNIEGLTVFVDVEFLSSKPPVSDAIGRTDVIFAFTFNPQRWN
ncbi:hypothetical protein Tco_0726735 [Tanacetum coccineum]|uniref:Uncharacterized protein n=1 Tax=Tanacetum coccineum TaxID=301880 RepID=A0ABQ4YGE9_9ASTR